MCPRCDGAVDVSEEVDRERCAQRRLQCRKALVCRASDSVHDVDAMLTEASGQGVEWIGDVRGRHMSASAAFGLSTCSIGADDGHTIEPADRQRKHVCAANGFVAQQHHACSAGTAYQVAVAGQIVRQLGPRSTVVKCSEPTHDRQHCARRAAHIGCGHLALRDGVEQLLATVQRRPGHLQIEPGDHTFGGRV